MPTFVHDAPAVDAIEGRDPNHLPMLAAAGGDSGPLIIDGAVLVGILLFIVGCGGWAFAHLSKQFTELDKTLASLKTSLEVLHLKNSEKAEGMSRLEAKLAAIERELDTHLVRLEQRGGITFDALLALYREFYIALAKIDEIESFLENCIVDYNDNQTGSCAKRSYRRGSVGLQPERLEQLKHYLTIYNEATPGSRVGIMD